MSEEELDARWRQIVRPSVASALAGLRAPGSSPGRGAWLAVDSQGHRHLLVEIPRDSEPLTEYSTRGLEVGTDELEIGEHPTGFYADLLCLDPALHPTFNAVAGEIIVALASEGVDAREAVVGSLERWKWFWSVESPGLSRTDALGLLGELWFLDRWLGISTAAVEAWHGPDAARHDFRWGEASVEVKTTGTRSDGAGVHRIQSLDQLDDAETGTLHLFSLQVSADPLAANSLPGLIEHILKQMRDAPSLARSFNDRLGKAGYHPAEADRHRDPVRVVAEELYSVEGDFPRLTRQSFVGGVPGGVEDVSYSLNLGACGPWRVATTPADVGADFLKR